LTKSTSSFARRSRNLLAVFCVALAGNLFFLSHARAEDVVPPEVTTIVTNGGDDVSYHVPLTVSVVYDGVTYENVYATTNSVITFGNPDGTYWTYPTTPSISIESRDWWALPTQNPDMHFIISVSDGGFQVDGSYLPYGTMTGETTSIIITAQIQTDGTVAYTYAVDGPLYGGERTGARLTDGTIVTLEQAGVTQVDEAPVLEPEPVEPEPEPVPVDPVPEPPVVDPTPEPTPEPVPEPQPEPAPRPVIELPVFVPEPEPVPVEEEPVPEPEPDIPLEPTPDLEPVPEEEAPVEVEPVEESNPIETPIVEPVEEETIQVDEVDLETLDPDTPVELENGVVLTAGVVLALELFDNPAQLLTEIFTNPAQVLTALSNIGADMSEEEREESTKTILAAVIVGQIATQSAVAAAASAAAASSTYRRKP
jgi:hypothetical protein